MHPAALAGADPRAALLAQLMHGGGGGPGPGGPPPGMGPGGPPPGPDAGPDPGGPDALDNSKISPIHAVQSVIEDLHDLMKILPDPGAVNVAATCLKAMTGLQHTMMKPGGANGAG